MPFWKSTKTMATPWTTGRSWSVDAAQHVGPQPGKEKICSTITAPAQQVADLHPKIVTTGYGGVLERRGAAATSAGPPLRPGRADVRVSSASISEARTGGPSGSHPYPQGDRRQGDILSQAGETMRMRCTGRGKISPVHGQRPTTRRMASQKSARPAPGWRRIVRRSQDSAGAGARHDAQGEPTIAQ